MSEIPTLRDVAAAAGVSKSTAQRALANDPRCSSKTCELVKRIALEINYIPDPVFAAVGTRRRTKKNHGTPLAYLVELNKGKQTRGVSYFDFCQSRAAELGYKVEMIDIARLETPKRLWQMLYARGFAGVLIGSVRSKFHPMLLDNVQFPAVCVGRVDSLPYHTARPAIMLGVRKIWDEMVKLGYRRIGAAICHHNPPVEDDFSRFSAAVGSHMLDFPNDEPIPPLIEDFNSHTQFIPWVKCHKPDAIIGFSDAFWYFLKDAGYTVPRDIGFASLHVETNTAKSVAGICENTQLVAVSAVNLIDQMIRHGERGVPPAPVNLMVEGTWHPGRSLHRQHKQPSRKVSPA